jgi:hypothetical protein
MKAVFLILLMALGLFTFCSLILALNNIIQFFKSIDNDD